ncbi:MAG: 2-oxoglutarate dehydrogenase E1 component, partial [Eudoraea sp.]|nr:2-oxoglutarate dehydrogenase E1 component [Eudoraea sp.]
MDKYSFLNAAHTSFFAEMYDKYLTNPDSVEPSWRAFFQGFDFGLESALDEVGIDTEQGVATISNGDSITIPETLHKEFQVVRLIDGYRSRGHLFTKTNPVRERRKYSPKLDIENFGLSDKD